MYVCITESHCTAEIKHNTVNQLYFNKIKNKNRVPPKPGTEITQMLLLMTRNHLTGANILSSHSVAVRRNVLTAFWSP